MEKAEIVFCSPCVQRLEWELVALERGGTRHTHTHTHTVCEVWLLQLPLAEELMHRRRLQEDMYVISAFEDYYLNLYGAVVFACSI